MHKYSNQQPSRAFSGTVPAVVENLSGFGKVQSLQAADAGNNLLQVPKDAWIKS